MDGTFSNTCRKPRINQIYTIHFKYKKEYHAGAIILTENRLTKTYQTIFNWLTKEVEVLKKKEITIMTDFEKSTIKALRKCFPCAKIHGCFFHFAQAVIKRWQKLKIKVPDSVLSMYLSVPLLPPECFKEAARCLEEEIHKVAAIDDNILRFNKYFIDVWLKHPEHVSVFNVSTKSTGGPESFHRHNKTKLGGVHPIVWKLIDGIEKVVIDEEINYCRLNNGKPTKKHTPQYLIDRSNYIRKIQGDLGNGLTVKEFLKMFPKSFEEMQYTIKKLIADCELHLIEDEPDPSILDITFDEKRKGEEIACIHKSLKHLQNITNKINSSLRTGKVTINTWLQRKKKRSIKTNRAASSKECGKVKGVCKYVFKPISRSTPKIKKKPVSMASILMGSVDTRKTSPSPLIRIDDKSHPASSQNGTQKNYSTTLETSVAKTIPESLPKLSETDSLGKCKSNNHLDISVIKNNQTSTFIGKPEVSVTSSKSPIYTDNKTHAAYQNGTHKNNSTALETSVAKNIPESLPKLSETDSLGKCKSNNHLDLSVIKKNQTSTFIGKPEVNVTSSKSPIYTDNKTHAAYQNGTHKNNSTALETSVVKTIPDRSPHFSGVVSLKRCNSKNQLDLSKLKRIPISASQIPMKLSRTRLNSLIRVTSKTLPAPTRDGPEKFISNKLQTSTTEKFPESLPGFSAVHFEEKNLPNYYSNTSVIR
ncbi:uncharacterized protein LOC130677345 [Microplitis mediator]|uniref:uncharacterized protein LOC130677345 n=1 Tax=Microplitis mediator TaxID=375433 RepID=UPI002555233B|nr:uncharacterized protein LOC130677345 [Microplitis mediator]